MKDKIYELTGTIKEEINNRKNYYAKGKKQIAVSNLKVLFATSIATTASLVIFILLTPSIIKGWKPTVYHISFIPAMLFLCIVTSVFYLRKREHPGEQMTMFLCVLFIVLLTGFCVLVDTAGTPDAPATFSDMMFIVLPAILIMLLRWAYSLIAVMVVFYIAAILIFKESQVGQYDIFSSVVALACSVIVSNLITHLRVRDYSIQTKYKVLSMIDTLTGILNKHSTRETLEEYLKRRHDNSSCVLILMDLDNFKGANDTFGHEAGDTILRHVGNILRETFRQVDAALYEAKRAGKAKCIIHMYEEHSPTGQ